MCKNELSTQDLRKLWYHSLRMRAFSYTWSLQSPGHVTKMAVTQFDPPLSKTPCYTQTLWLYGLQNRSGENGGIAHVTFTLTR